MCPCLLCCVARKCCQVASSVAGMWGRLGSWASRVLAKKMCSKRGFTPGFGSMCTFTNLSRGIGAIWGCWENNNPKYQIFLWTVNGWSKRAGQCCLRATSKSSSSLLNLPHFKLHLEILNQTWNFSQRYQYSFISLLWLLNMCPAKEIHWRGRRKFLSSLMLSSLRSSDSVVLWKHKSIKISANECEFDFCMQVVLFFMVFLQPVLKTLFQK